MRFKDVLKNNPFTIAIILFATLVSGITFIYSKTVAIAELIIIIAIAVGALKWLSYTADRKKDLFHSIENSLSETGNIGGMTSAFPFPLVVIDNNGKIEWFNSLFDAIINGIGEKYSNNIKTFITNADEFLLDSNFSSFEISTVDSHYTVFPSRIGENAVALYFIDDTELKRIRKEFKITRPAVLLINVDSLEHTEDVLDHADYYAVVSDIEREITKWLVENKCIFRKFSDGKFFAITEISNLDHMIKNKFSILDKIRLYRYSNQEVDITLSVGVGKERTFAESENNARQALDMARGRGGDQVAVKLGDDYKFFGGTTSRKEKRGKIKSRIISAALCEYIEKCSAVFVMGHSFSDYDAIGACVGISAIARATSKPAYIIVNRKTSLALPLIDLLEKENSGINFISPEKAAEIFTDDALLVITDTMRAQLVESPEILKKSKCTILIDHHRKTVDYIDSVALEFHEPYASSACEMVTELVQYSPVSAKLTPHEAEALLSGIILDTKNYTLRVGVRTFEAAAYLKDCKMDTVTVKKLFAGTVEENVSVSKLISSAEFYDRYVISVADKDQTISRLIASKAADELLNIEGVDASFVVYVQDDVINVSARSFGVINVQLIMEAFGGGGHHSMAACQCSDISIDLFVQKLNDAVKAYIKNNK
ncbi:MAG: DHH family phosphoesterase [Clostridia bacterium]|nr:DHH family phosphoesterase [Clostridia bacterium]